MHMSPLEATSRLLDISVTERGEFRTCRRRWYLSTILNLQSKGQGEIALSFGTAIHSALEIIYRADLSDPEQLRATVLLEMQAWKDVQAGLDLTQSEWEEVLDLVELGEIMLHNYFAYENRAPVKLGRPVAVEGLILDEDRLKPSRPDGYGPYAEVVRHESGRLMVPIVDPYTKVPITSLDGIAYLTGRIDVLTERLTPKLGLWVVDHKSAATAPSDKGLDWDDQVTGYCYIVWRWLGIVPRGVIFNYLIKNAPSEPRLVKGKKKGEGLVLSTAKDQQTTPDLYREALKEHGLMSGGRITSEKHADCLAALLARGDEPFYRRYEVTRNMEQLLSFERRLVAEHRDMTLARFGREEDELLYPNPHRMLCPRCSVSSICLALEDGSDVEDIIDSQYVTGPDRKAMKLEQ
jgi:hypothetical protein